MDQKKVWETTWKNKNKQSSNNFVRRSFFEIKNKSFKTLLDVGCGVGVDSIYFAKKGLNVTAIDFSENAINYLKKIITNNEIVNITPVFGNITKLNFTNNSFDVIYAHLSIHYFNNQVTTKIFDDFYRILKPKGLFFIKCKSIDDNLYGQGEKIEKDMFMLNGHVRHFFSKNYMEKKLKKFKIIKIRKTSSVYHEYKSFFIEATATK